MTEKRTIVDTKTSKIEDLRALVDLIRQEYKSRYEYVVSVLEKIKTRDGMLDKKFKEASELAQEIIVETKKERKVV